jgi:hypothetical protein
MAIISSTIVASVATTLNISTTTYSTIKVNIKIPRIMFIQRNHFSTKLSCVNITAYMEIAGSGNL